MSSRDDRPSLGPFSFVRHVPRQGHALLIQIAHHPCMHMHGPRACTGALPPLGGLHIEHPSGGPGGLGRYSAPRGCIQVEASTSRQGERRVDREASTSSTHQDEENEEVHQDEPHQPPSPPRQENDDVNNEEVHGQQLLLLMFFYFTLFKVEF